MIGAMDAAYWVFAFLVVATVLWIVCDTVINDLGRGRRSWPRRGRGRRR